LSTSGLTEHACGCRITPTVAFICGTSDPGGTRAGSLRLGTARRAEELRGQLSDARGGRVVFLSHCLLNQNVRYLGELAGRAV
jgi:hypothetical protein